MRYSVGQNGRVVGLSLALAVPLLLFALNRNWVFTNPFQPPWFDAFVYQGLFVHPQEFVSTHRDYYPATRVPWIALGAAFYSVLPTIVANITLKFFVTAITLYSVFDASDRIAGRLPATAAVILLGTYTYFVMSVGWDYLDGMVTMLLAASYAAVARAGSKRVWSFDDVLLGFLFASLLCCNLFTAALAPPIAIFYIAIVWRHQSFAWGTIPSRLGAVCLGVALGLALLSAISFLIGGDPLFIEVQIRAVLDLSAPAAASASWSIRFAPWAHLLPVATWTAIPASVFLAAVVVGTAAAIRATRRSSNRRDGFMALIALHFVTAFGLFMVSTAVSLAVLLFWFYTSYLSVPAFITLACMLSYVGEPGRGGTGVFLPWMVVGLALFAIHHAGVGGLLQAFFGFTPGGVALTTSLIWASAGTFVLLFGSLRWPSYASILGGLLLAVSYLSMMTHGQLSPSFTTDRFSGFRALELIAETIRAASGSPRRFVWIDRLEQPYGGLYHAAWITSLLSAKDPVIGYDGETRFPNLPRHGFRAGDFVVIATTRADWRDAADRSLSPLQLSVRPTRISPVSEGVVQFNLVVGELVPLPGSL